MFLLNQENSYNGSPSIFDVDLKGLLSYVELEGNLVYCLENGVRYSDIIQSIFNEIEKVDGKTSSGSIMLLTKLSTVKKGARLNYHVKMKKYFTQTL